MHRLASTALVTAAFLGALATPASSAVLPSAEGSVQSSVAVAPVGEWTWHWQSNTQSQNGLVNISTNGNLCVGLLGVLAPSTPCTNS
jgi:Spy/CpxP family protein refolding chaperone